MRISSTFFNHRIFIAFATLFGVALTISSCAKKREASLAETDARTTHTVTEFKNLTLKVKTIQLGADVSTKIQNLESHSLNSTKTADFILYSSVDLSSVPENLQYMFKKLKVMAPANSVLTVQFDVDSSYLTAYKAAEEKLLNPIEKSLLKQSSLNSGRLPLFKYKITQFGVLEKERNEFQEQTAKLVLRKTEFEAATHIQISEFTQDRLTVDLSADARKQLTDLRNRSSIDNLVFSGKDLAAVSPLFSTSENSNYHVKIDNGQLLTSEVVNKNSVSSEQKLLPCHGVDVAGLDQASCGLLPAKVYALKFFEAVLKVEGEEIYGNEISFAEGSNSSSLIQITNPVEAQTTSVPEKIEAPSASAAPSSAPASSSSAPSSNPLSPAGTEAAPVKEVQQQTTPKPSELPEVETEKAILDSALISIQNKM